MKKSVVYLLMLVLCFCLSCNVGAAAQQMPLDSAAAAALSSRMAEYFSALEHEGAQVQMAECDFMIETCTEPAVRQFVALEAYRHYRDSKVMGSEAVAIHIFDTWFASSHVDMGSEMEFMAAKVFAEFNRNSLIGMKAPAITMQAPDGSGYSLFEEPDPRYRVLYFYDTDCPTCKVQTILLRNLFSEKDYPIDFYAVYADDDYDAWISYAGEQLKFSSGNVRTVHLWDPEFDSDFQRQYGVLQTPAMFLISPDGVILGRRLDAHALSLMLDMVFAEKELSYGSEESMRLFAGIFAGGAPDAEEVKGVADYISRSTLEKGDTVMFRQMTGDMLYYVSSRREEGFKEGLAYLIDKYILPRNDVWRSGDDSLKVVGMAEVFDDLLSRSEPGRLVPDLKLPGTLLTSKKSKAGDFRLRKLKGKRNIIMFVTPGCNVCAAEKEAARRMVSSEKGVKVLMVDVDEMISGHPSLAGRIFDSFDLSSLPFIFETDRKGYLVRRYISL
jgi:peroxiredoxin